MCTTRVPFTSSAATSSLANIPNNASVIMEDREQTLARHRKEQKDLQARVTQKKKGASKKTRKGVNSECEDLERQLKEKHQQELSALDGETPPDADEVPELDSDTPNDSTDDAAEKPVNGLQDSTISTPPNGDENTALGSGQGTKRNRQKERLARRAAEQEAAAIEAEKEAAKLPNWKRQERSAMLREFKSQGLDEKEIQPDGHCLFSAVADQLLQAGIPLGGDAGDVAETERYRVVRRAAAHWMEGHPDDFAPFLEEPLGVYVHKIRDTAEWGGQLELLALARSYKVEICVLQDGRTERIEPGEEAGKDLDKIWLAYYRHGYGLGEHYNSLRKNRPAQAAKCGGEER